MEEFISRYLGFFAVAVLWTLIWKVIALWRSARNDHKAWFVILLIVNTLGLLEIIYILTAGRASTSQSAR